jgi:hypothetical protein
MKSHPEWHLINLNIYKLFFYYAYEIRLYTTKIVLYYAYN